jgi:uncharacterized protein (DUF486 family)
VAARDAAPSAGGTPALHSSFRRRAALRITTNQQRSNPATALLAVVPLLAMRTVLITVGLLVVSNIFMTFAWYAHLKNLSAKPWFVAALVSWGVALFEYLVQVPANRIGFERLSLAQLKIVQEVVTLAVFVPFAIFYMRQPLSLNFVWAGLCLVGAVFFMFR